MELGFCPPDEEELKDSGRQPWKNALCPTSWASESHSFYLLYQQVKAGLRLSLRSRETRDLTAGDPQSHPPTQSSPFSAKHRRLFQERGDNNGKRLVQPQRTLILERQHVPVLSAYSFSWGERQLTCWCRELNSRAALPPGCRSEAPGPALHKHWVPGFFTNRGPFILFCPSTRCLGFFLFLARLCLLQNDFFLLF